MTDLLNLSVYTFKFSAPWEYDYTGADAPWNRECQNEDLKIAPEERIGLEKWITDYATVTKPVRRAMAVKTVNGK